MPIFRTLYICVNKDVRICGHFSKPKGVRGRGGRGIGKQFCTVFQGEITIGYRTGHCAACTTHTHVCVCACIYVCGCVCVFTWHLKIRIYEQKAYFFLNSWVCRFEVFEFLTVVLILRSYETWRHAGMSFGWEIPAFRWNLLTPSSR